MEQRNDEGKTDDKDRSRDRLARLLQGIGWAEQRSITVGDEFIRLEVQIAAILFAFSSLFLDKFDRDYFPGISWSSLILIKLAFATSLLFLIASLGWGLLHLKNREIFCGKVLQQRGKRYSKWMEAANGSVSYKEALAFHEGSALGEGGLIRESNWTWILQTICLAIGVAGLFVLSVVFLFYQ